MKRRRRMTGRVVTMRALVVAAQTVVALVVMALAALAVGPSGVAAQGEPEIPPQAGDAAPATGAPAEAAEAAPAPVALPAPRDVPTLLHDAAAQYGLDEARFKRIAWCESRYNPLAVSPGGHKGVFQFADRTWAWASAQAGYAGASPFNAEANIYTAAWLMSQPGGYAHWSCK